MGAAAPIGQRPVLAPLDLVQPIQHPISLLQLDAVLLVVRLLVLVRVEALDLEGAGHQYTRSFGSNRVMVTGLEDIRTPSGSR